MRSCFRQAEKIHWGPQLVVLKGTIAAKDGLGGIDDGAVVENSLHDADSNACFLAAVAAARFTLKPEDVGQSKNFRFQHVPKVQ